MANDEREAESYWDLLNEVARLQRLMGKDMVAWSQVYEATGKAMQGNGDTMALMAELGRRTERLVQNGPPAAVRRATEFLFNPLQAMGAASGAAPGPLARIWEAWAAALPGNAPAEGKESSGGE